MKFEEDVFNAIVDVFEEDELERLLDFKMNLSLRKISTSKNHKDLTYAVLQKIGRRGQLKEFYEYAKAERGNNKEFKETMENAIKDLPPKATQESGSNVVNFHKSGDIKGKRRAIVDLFTHYNYEAFRSAFTALTGFAVDFGSLEHEILATQLARNFDELDKTKIRRREFDEAAAEGLTLSFEIVSFEIIETKKVG